MQVIEARDDYLSDDDPMLWYRLANKIQSHWYMVNTALGAVAAAVAGSGAQYFCVAIQNEQMKTAKFLEGLCGVCPIQRKEDFMYRGNYNFDHLKGEPE